jgi:glycerophosphoryl diester phosphodiesterase
VRELLPDANTLALIEAVPISMTAFAKDAGATHVGTSIDSITAGFVNALRNNSLKVFAYAVDDPRDISSMRALGVDGIITNFPDHL